MHTGHLPSSPTLRLSPRLLVFALVSVVGLLLLAGAPPSSASVNTRAAACDGTAIDKTVKGLLTNSANDGTPVAGVVITVTNCDGEEFPGETVEDGSFEIPFTAGIGPVTVTIDPDTLPDGVNLRDGASTTNVLTGSLSTLNTTFPIGADGRDLKTKWDRIPELIYSGLLFGLILAMAALGLNMIFGTTGLTNFAHGELVSFGAIVAFYFSTGIPLPFTDSDINLPFLVAAPIAVLLAMVFGWLQDTGPVATAAQARCGTDRR